MSEHETGNINCSECWSNFPKRHKGCGGLVHAEFGDEDYDGYWLQYFPCEKCGQQIIDDDELEYVDSS